MIINKSSWHYRFLQKMETYPMPKTLCEYFWTLVGKFFLFLIMSSIVFLFTAGYPILAWSAFHNHSNQALSGFICLVGLPTILGVVVGVVLLNDKIRYKSEPNIFFETIKAYKNKVCPLITYKDAS